MLWLWQERDRLHHSVCCRQSVMVSMGVSKLGELPRIDLIFVHTRVKINDAYYRDVLLTQKLPSVMRKICGEFFILQQGSVSAHRARGTINLLKRDTCVHFTWPFATQQHRSEPDWLQQYRRNAAAGLASSWRRWTEAALNRCMASFQAKHRR